MGGFSFNIFQKLSPNQMYAVYLQPWQVLYGQLLLNPPGQECSKGGRS